MGDKADCSGPRQNTGIAQRGGKPGLLELADRGTVFLDEVGEMSPYLQAKLLRFLSDGCFRQILRPEA